MGDRVNLNRPCSERCSRHVRRGRPARINRLTVVAEAWLLSSVTPGTIGRRKPGWRMIGRSGEREMRCIECDIGEVSERPERTARGYRRFRCRANGKQFMDRCVASKVMNPHRVAVEVLTNPLIICKVAQVVAETFQPTLAAIVS